MKIRYLNGYTFKDNPKPYINNLEFSIFGIPVPKNYSNINNVMFSGKSTLRVNIWGFNRKGNLKMVQELIFLENYNPRVKDETLYNFYVVLNNIYYPVVFKNHKWRFKYPLLDNRWD